MHLAQEELQEEEDSAAAIEARQVGWLRQEEELQVEAAAEVPAQELHCFATIARRPTDQQSGPRGACT